MSSRGAYIQVSGFAAIALLLAGCTGWSEPPCARFKQEQKETDYRTHYRLTKSQTENALALPRGHDAAVQQYRVRVVPSASASCTHLTVHKKFYLHQNNGKPLAIEEVREFYTVDGALIATKTEAIGKQLRGSGWYTGMMALPIPENAPPGKYRIVSKIVVKRDNQRTELASSSATFKVLTRN